MKQHFVPFLIFLFGIVSFSITICFASGEGNVNGVQSETQAIRSMADLYTLKTLHPDVGTTGDSNIVVSTKYSTLQLKCFENLRADSTVYLKCRTQQKDTIMIAIPALSWTPKLPPIDIIFKSGSPSDSLLGGFQKQ